MENFKVFDAKFHLMNLFLASFKITEFSFM